MAALVLIIGNDKERLQKNRRRLSKEGFTVALCTDCQNITHRIDKIKPDVVLINTTSITHQSTDIYNNLVDTVRYAALPVIFALSEDDVYLVNRRRTSQPETRSVIANTAIDAVHKALENPQRHTSSELSFRDFRKMYRA